MTPIRTKLNDIPYSSGLVLITLSLLIFCMHWLVGSGSEQSGWFIGNYGIAALYFLGILFAGRLRKGREGLPLMFNFLVLFLISAYALNREMTVFEESVPWLSTSLAVVCVNYLAFQYWEVMPRWLLHLMYFVLGGGLMLFVYLSIYLTPMYAISAVAALALGFSLHTFVPLLFCIYTIVLLRKTAAGRRSYQLSFGTGIAAVLIVATAFTIRWGTVVREINQRYNEGIVQNSQDLPAWIRVASAVPRGWIAEEVLQSELVYNVPSGDPFRFWDMPRRNFGEQRRHDPLVMTAAFFAGNVRFSEDERIKILESMYDSRHFTQERLWSGKDLVTDNIRTSVKVWPALHMAYTEKLVTVTSRAARASWPRQEEAIYTFHLPEGSVVSSLSLWIKGLEQKAVVTTKEKAQEAYTQIVGVESRDPSVVHWQEGNTVSVRVFPVVAGESRVFKLGVTTPLLKQHDSLSYENIYFEGPDARAATETISMQFEKHPQNLASEASFRSDGHGAYSHTGAYDPAWTICFKDEGIDRQTFSFDGTTYAPEPYRVQRVPVSFETAYLDVNAAWTKAEFDQVLEAVKGKVVYVYDREPIRLTTGNKDRLFDVLHQARFSLFPLYAINDPAHALLVSKSAGRSPNLHDLEADPFMVHTKTFLKQDTQVSLFNLGRELSPYLASLKELRVFRYEQGTAAELGLLLRRGLFTGNPETGQKVVLDQAGLCITATNQPAPSLAPDHLMRLFLYNHIMQQTGARLYADTAYTSGLTGLAAKAAIVTPVSSMVVLETQADYDRFNIEKSKNSLENASLHSKGAVPEPHEWALLIMALLTVGWARFLSSKKKTARA